MQTKYRVIIISILFFYSMNKSKWKHAFFKLTLFNLPAIITLTLTTHFNDILLSPTPCKPIFHIYYIDFSLSFFYLLLALNPYFIFITLTFHSSTSYLLLTFCFLFLSSTFLLIWLNSYPVWLCNLNIVIHSSPLFPPYYNFKDLNLPPRILNLSNKYLNFQFFHKESDCG